MLATIASLVTIAGLFLTVIGAYIAARSVVLTDDQAVTIGVARYAARTKEENLRLPAVQSLLKQSKSAQKGFWFIVVGTVAQIVSAVMPLFL